MSVYWKWIPESPAIPGLYANLCGTDLCGKVGDPSLQKGTFVISDARMFSTYEDCREWCNKNPSPPFEPRQHGFYDDPKRGSDA